jgi:hypothetical protein
MKMGASRLLAIRSLFYLVSQISAYGVMVRLQAVDQSLDPLGPLVRARQYSIPTGGLTAGV